MFSCQECGRKFRTVKAAEKAASNGCPSCGGVDIDLDVPVPPMMPASNNPFHYPNQPRGRCPICQGPKDKSCPH